ncbi:hypothetical protein Hanom_Chr09g00854531 [Helianthus anomalus]
MREKKGKLDLNNQPGCFWPIIIQLSLFTPVVQPFSFCLYNGPSLKITLRS